MLTSIELHGFKSFADRTKIDFDGDICALVGPNGSGKSNVVDAIKWALGEQSARRLRGDEMTDVIFNGSATRQPLGSAEVTISFDNQKRLLPVKADRIHLTRRVYRSGESEYLINGQSARLKDFRDIVGGAGPARRDTRSSSKDASGVAPKHERTASDGTRGRGRDLAIQR